ncbi:hypothetical protein KA005_83285 [bacterium]|nr:hypothetical protein [bacterium]
MIRNTSLEAFKDLPQLTINKQEKKILKYVMSRAKKVTRHQIARALKMQTGTISARVNSMLKWGVLSENSKTVCPISKRTVGAISA